MPSRCDTFIDSEREIGTCWLVGNLARILVSLSSIHTS